MQPDPDAPTRTVEYSTVPAERRDTAVQIGKTYLIWTKQPLSRLSQARPYEQKSVRKLFGMPKSCTSTSTSTTSTSITFPSARMAATAYQRTAQQLHSQYKSREQSSSCDEYPACGFTVYLLLCYLPSAAAVQRIK